MAEADGPAVSENVSRATGGLTYARMIELAKAAQLKQTLEIIATESVNLFDRVIAQGVLR